MNVKLLRRVKKAILQNPKHFTMEYPSMCVAGWACKLAGLSYEVRQDDKSCTRAAAKLLCITPGQANRLFYEYYKVDEPKFYAAWTGRTKEAAELMAERIEQFIKTKGAR